MIDVVPLVFWFCSMVKSILVLELGVGGVSGFSLYFSLEYNSSSSGLDSVIELCFWLEVVVILSSFSFLISRVIPVDCVWLFLREGVNLGCSFVSDIDVNVVWVWALLAVSLVGVFVIIGVVGAVGDLWLISLCHFCLGELSWSEDHVVGMVTGGTISKNSSVLTLFHIFLRDLRLSFSWLYGEVPGLSKTKQYWQDVHSSGLPAERMGTITECLSEAQRCIVWENRLGCPSFYYNMEILYIYVRIMLRQNSQKWTGKPTIHKPIWTAQVFMPRVRPRMIFWRLWD